MTLENRPTISVVIPVFNRACFIARAIKSVLSQSLLPNQIVVVDDASTDSSAQVAEKILSAHSVPWKVLRLEQNKGVSFARNQGIRALDTEWISFLDSDDEWLPSKLEKQIALLNETNLKVCHTNEIWKKNGKHFNQHKKHEKRGGRIFLDSLRMCAMSPSSVLLHKSVLDQVGLFDESLEVCEDYDLWLRVSCQFEVAYCSEPLLIKHGGHSDQLSNKYKGMDYFRILALEKIKRDFISHLTSKEVEALQHWIDSRKKWLGPHFESMSKGERALRPSVAP